MWYKPTAGVVQRARPVRSCVENAGIVHFALPPETPSVAVPVPRYSWLNPVRPELSAALVKLTNTVPNEPLPDYVAAVAGL